jgi:hypothetical protein
MIADGTIDASLLKSLKKGKKLATSNVATFNDPMMSRIVPNTMPTYEKVMVTSKPEFVNMTFSGYTPQLKFEQANESKTILRWAATSRSGKSTPRRSREHQQLSRRRTLQQVRAVSKVLHPSRNTRRHKDKLPKKCASLTIGVFEDVDEPLHFPEEEALEVDEVQLRSDHQLPDPYPHSKPSKGKDVISNEKSNHVSNVPVKYDGIAHLKKIPAMLSVYDDLCLSSDLRKAFITTLSFPEDYRVEVSQTEIKPNRSDDMIFNDEDLLLGNKKHNMPLFMFGDIDDLPINHIMVDSGSAINLLLLCTLKKIGYSQRDLSRSNVVIQGFNQARQEAVGMISLVLKLEKFMTYVNFHVIDAATSYSALLGHPWLHENKIVPSTLHQCLKYKDPLGEVVTIFIDKKPFTVAESFYADAKFYIESVDIISKPKIKASLDLDLPKKDYGETSSHKMIYQYVPSNQRKRGEPIFHITYKLTKDEGINFPTPLPPLVQQKIKEANDARHNKDDVVAHVILFDRDNKTLPISLYDGTVLYMMQQMGYDISTSPSLCDGRGKLPFEESLSQAQLDALHEDKILIEEKYGLGHEVHMTSIEPIDVTPDAPQMEDGHQLTIHELEEIDIVMPNDPHPVFISKHLSTKSKEEYKRFLSENRDIFVWSYEEMPGLDPSVAMHRLAMQKNYPPVKQGQRRYRPELHPQIEAEVDKLIVAGFIREVKYPTWVSSIVPVKKKNGQIRICVDFMDLNKACPKDYFPILILEILIDSTVGYEIFSFMDGFSGYNQIKMAPEDEELTALRTPKGIYCYKVMSFRLKNAGHDSCARWIVI